MKFIITESQYKLIGRTGLFEGEIISELERTWSDSEYEDQYERLKGGMIKIVKKMMVSYFGDEEVIYIYGKDKKRLMSYYKTGNELYYDRSISKIMETILPHPMWLVHGKYIMSDVFESFFPDHKVKRCYSANMS
jgi:hypothetical protein